MARFFFSIAIFCNQIWYFGLIENSQNRIKEQSDEIVALRDVISHLNTELSAYQAKYQSPVLKQAMEVNFFNIFSN